MSSSDISGMSAQRRDGATGEKPDGRDGVRVFDFTSIALVLFVGGASLIFLCAARRCGAASSVCSVVGESVRVRFL